MKQADVFEAFEKKQLTLLEKLIELLQNLISKNTIEKEVQSEIIFNVQMIATLINKEIGEKLTERNNTNIIKVEAAELSKKEG
jgi:hypothetical protein